MGVEVGFLCIGGTELINDARTLSYLYRGLAGPAMAAAIGVQTSGSVSGDVEAVYADAYADSYGTPITVDCGSGTFEPVCLRCACPTLTLGETFFSPGRDDAPWHLSTVFQSGEFLGVVADNIELLPAFITGRQARVRFGGSKSPHQLLPRVMQVTARLFASTPAGMEWGKRWFTDVLAGACDDEAGVDATYLPYCPRATQDADQVYRSLADVAVIDGPLFAAAGHFQGFRVETVAFQLSSSAPWLLGLPTPCQTATLAAGTSTSCLITTADWGGGKALRLELGGALDGVNVRAVPLTSDQPCPIAGTGMACSEFTLRNTQPGDSLIVDSSRRRAVLYDASSKVAVSAVPYMDFAALFPWIEVGPCGRLCVTVTNGGSGSVTVDMATVLTEL